MAGPTSNIGRIMEAVLIVVLAIVAALALALVIAIVQYLSRDD
jgi:hypothetical protein